MIQDFHLHTLVSDGELDPLVLVARVARLDVVERLAALKDAGLDERAFAARVTARAAELGLRTTRGSDSHTDADFDRVYRKAAKS